MRFRNNSLKFSKILAAFLWSRCATAQHVFEKQLYDVLCRKLTKTCDSLAITVNSSRILSLTWRIQEGGNRYASFVECLHDLANVQQFTCILNTFAASLLDVCWVV